MSNLSQKMSVPLLEQNPSTCYFGDGILVLVLVSGEGRTVVQSMSS
jgi:hypothetical protein